MQAQPAVLERISLRGLERFLGISRPTIALWIEGWATQLPPLEDTLAEAQGDDVLELDEVRSFVLKKDQQRWIWVALCRRACQIVAYFIGDRTETSCLQLWRRPPQAVTRLAISGTLINGFSRRIAINR